MYPNENEYRPYDNPEAGSAPVSEAPPAEPSGQASYTNPNPAQEQGQYSGAAQSQGSAQSYSVSGAASSEWHGSPYGNPTPPQPPKPKKVREKKGFTWGRVIALCLVCAILGGCVSGGAFVLLGRNSSAVTASGTAAPDNENTSTILESARTTTDVTTQTVAAGEKMTVAQIYAAYANSVACIEVSTSSGTGAGTGFVITADGYIVTCYHVIDGATDIAVTFPDSSSYEATLVGGDEDQDIAVLKIDASGLTPVVLGDSSTLQVGDTVTAIGNALGTLANTTTTGIVSALDRAISMSDGTVINVLQTDCTVNSGNSGGPLFNEYGEVIGIVNAKYSSSGYSSTATIEGIGFAIPYADVATKITDLMEYGYITGKPYLGISVSTVSALEAQKYNMVVGAYVNSVTEGSCAETAGLQQGDIITAVDGTDITTYEELVNAKNQHSAGDEMELTVYRSGEVLELTVILDEEVPSTDTADSSDTSDNSGSSDEYSSDGYSSDGYSSDGYSSDGSDMTPEDFFNYFFGGNGNSGSSRGSGGW